MVVKSRLLARLDSAIALSRTAVDAACLRAERAAFLGRHGQMELARRELQDIQRRFSREPHVAVSGWLALAEGQLELYRRLHGSGFEHFQRAHAFSRAAGLQSLQALSAAWLAQTHAGTIELAELARLVQMAAEALRLAAPDDHSARWRACLTIGTQYQSAGRMDLAQPWYGAARRHALADGDEVAMSALMYNQSGLRAEAVRREAAFGDACPTEAKHAVMGTESIVNFDAALGVQSLEWLVPMVRAQLLVLEKRFAEALALFDEHSGRAEDEWRERMEPSILADRAWCLLNLDRQAEARDEALLAAEKLPASPCHPDDRALTNSRLGELFESFGEAARAAEHHAAARRDLAEFQAWQLTFANMLNEGLVGLEPV
jgi:hypothetical protein